MLRNDFCVFILTHGRADRVITYKTIKKAGYTGPVFLVIDNEDEQADEYIRRYGEENVIVFDKQARAEKTDTPDLSQDHRTIIYARNECFDIADRLGYRYFLELDDDYTDFQYRYEGNGKLLIKSAKNLDDIFEEMLLFLDASGAITVAFAQGGDMIGGVQAGNFQKGLLRKAMNTFFCDTRKRFQFVGRINEDVNTYTSLGNKGKLMFTFTALMITQKTTQSNAGGMTETYLDMGTYLKSFYSVVYSPQAVKIGEMGDKHKRIHHIVNWDRCSPKILNEKWRKAENGAKTLLTDGPVAG